VRATASVGAVDGRGSVPRALLVSGTVGAGKTTAAEAVGEVLRAHGVPHAVIDLDWLRAGWPSPPDDPFNLDLELANLKCVAANHLRAGAQRLVLAGVLEDPAARSGYRDAVGVPLRVARLRADLSLVRARLRRRHHDRPAELNWHLDRCEQLHTILETASAEDFVVDTTDLTPIQVAAALLDGAGWAPSS
jgi:adenylylsulfate kinase